MCVISMWVCAAISSVSLGRIPFDFLQQDIPLIRRWMVQVRLHTHTSSIDMYNNDVGQESAQKFMKQTGALKDATLYFAS